MGLVSFGSTERQRCLRKLVMSSATAPEARSHEEEKVIVPTGTVKACLLVCLMASAVLSAVFSPSLTVHSSVVLGWISSSNPAPGPGGSASLQVQCALKVAPAPIFVVPGDANGLAFVTPVSPPSAPKPLDASEFSRWQTNDWPTPVPHLSPTTWWGPGDILPAPRYMNISSSLQPPSAAIPTLEETLYGELGEQLYRQRDIPQVNALAQDFTFQLLQPETGTRQGLAPEEVLALHRIFATHCSSLVASNVTMLPSTEQDNAPPHQPPPGLPLHCTAERAARTHAIMAGWAGGLPRDWASVLEAEVGGAGGAPHCVPVSLTQHSSIDVSVLEPTLTPASSSPSPLQALLGTSEYVVGDSTRAVRGASAPGGAASVFWRSSVVPGPEAPEQYSLHLSSAKTPALHRVAASIRAALEGSAPLPAIGPADHHGATFGRRFNCSGYMTHASEEECAGPALENLDSWLASIPRPTASAAILAQSVWGVPRGLASLLGLARGADGVMWMDAATVHDIPRAPWRGLLLDTARHFHSIDSIQRTLRAMASAKMNVFHWHISDAQSFPLPLALEDADGVRLSGAALLRYLEEAGTAAQLHGRVLSSSESLTGAFVAPFRPHQVYHREDVRSIVRYAASLGIRVLPEVDTPAHTASWVWALANAGAAAPSRSASSWLAWEQSLGKGTTGQDAVGGHNKLPWRTTPGLVPREAAAGWATTSTVGVVSPCHGLGSPSVAIPPNAPSINIVNKYALDVTANATYPILDAVLGAVLAEFPDTHMHWGGDEVVQECWTQNADMMEWVARHASALGVAEAGAGYMDERAAVKGLLARHAWHVSQLIVGAGKVPVVWQGTFDTLGDTHTRLQEGLASGDPARVFDGSHMPSLHAEAAGDKVPFAEAGMPPFSVIQPWKCWSGLDRQAIVSAAASSSRMASTRNSCWYLDWSSPFTEMHSHDIWSRFSGGGDATVSAGYRRLQPSGDPLVGWETSKVRSGIIGGEASMWSEGIIGANLHCRIWPRALVVAQKLWTWAPFAQVHHTPDFGVMQPRQRSLDAVSSKIGLWVDTARNLDVAPAEHHGMALAHYPLAGTCPLVHRFAQPAQETDLGAAALPSGPASAVPRMLTGQYNVAMGGQGLWPPQSEALAADKSGLLELQKNRGRAYAILDWLRGLDLDVAVIVEALEWQRDSLPSDGARMLWNAAPSSARGSFPVMPDQMHPGQPYCVGCLNTYAHQAGFAFSAMLAGGEGYNLAILARWPVHVLRADAENFERGMLVGVVRGLAVVAVHLHAHDSSQRTLEAGVLATTVRELQEQGFPVIVQGDFNTLSPLDVEGHNATGLLAWMQSPAVPRRILRKHTVAVEVAREWLVAESARWPPNSPAYNVCWTAFNASTPLQGVVLDYRPMCVLLAAGLVDACSQGPECSRTEPTAHSLVDNVRAEDMPAFRLDYAMMSPALARTASQCSVVATNATMWLSDHLPLVCSLTGD